MTETAIEYVTKIAGAWHRPPAKQILASVPKGIRLMLQPEFTNQYDPQAVKVLLDPSEIPGDFDELVDAGLENVPREKLPEGMESMEVIREAKTPLFLGYLARTGGKPLFGTDYPGNQEFLSHLGDDVSIWSMKPLGTLEFDANGDPLFSLDEDALLAARDLAENNELLMQVGDEDEEENFGNEEYDSED